MKSGGNPRRASTISPNSPAALTTLATLGYELATTGAEAVGVLHAVHDYGMLGQLVGTDTIEVMEILAGDLDVLLPGETTWKTIRAGELFRVPSHTKFSLKIKTLTDYCCSYE